MQTQYQHKKRISVQEIPMSAVQQHLNEKDVNGDTWKSRDVCLFIKDRRKQSWIVKIIRFLISHPICVPLGTSLRWRWGIYRGIPYDGLEDKGFQTKHVSRTVEAVQNK